MTLEGHAFERTPRIDAGRGMSSTGAWAAPAMLDGRERFAGYVAHELRAPIALQRALAEIALADPGADVAALREMGKRVVAGCIRQQRLIDALLDLVRGRRGLARQEPVDIAAIAAAALRAHDLSELESVVALERVWTTGDPELLERLAANLVSNAIRHNTVGGRIELATRARSGRAVLSIANTGPPIPSAELLHLFHRSQRVAPHPTDGAEGVGLGLAIVQAIADAHDAAIAAQARPGGGLRIDVAFPAIRGRGAGRGSANGSGVVNGSAAATGTSRRASRRRGRTATPAAGTIIQL
jgi:signal transduction histidine kinase